jgi:hypothetical protein
VAEREIVEPAGIVVDAALVLAEAAAATLRRVAVPVVLPVALPVAADAAAVRRT